MCDGKLSHMFDPTQIRSQALNRATVQTNNVTNEQMNEINDIPTNMKPIDLIYIKKNLFIQILH